MKALPGIILLLCVIHSLPARVWTDVLGRQIEAEYLSADDTSVRIRRNIDAQEFTLPLNKLSSRDRDYIANKRLEQADQTTRPHAQAFLEYQDYFESFRLNNKRIKARYLGTMALRNIPISKLPTFASGLAIDKAGRYAISTGSGTMPRMGLYYWDPEKGREEITPLIYKKYEEGQTRADKEELIADGKLWFYGGQVAIGRNGKTYITMGACCGNGIFEANSNGLERINFCTSSSSLQIPPWDQGHAYVGRGNHIYRFDLSSKGTPHAEGEIHFEITGENLYISDALLLDKQRVLLSLSKPTEEKDERGFSIPKRFSILVDAEQDGYFMLSTDSLGSMALAPTTSSIYRTESTPALQS